MVSNARANFARTFYKGEISMNRYVKTPDAVHYNDILNNDLVLSSSLFVKLVMPNTNTKRLAELLSRPLKRSDLGTEVGSLSYIKKSTKYFIRTKALQDSSYLPDMNSETCLPILPKEFVNMNLKEGDVIISKDSNIGEVVILDQDYPNCMLSGAIYKLPIKSEWKYYVLSFLKHNIFREQLDAIVPKGATIRHAKTKFLDCLIPLPNTDLENIVQYVSSITQAIINKEKLIKQRHTDILKLIDEELKNNQKDDTNAYHMPNLSDLQNVGRLDTGLYSKLFKDNISSIHSYTHGFYENIFELGYKLSRGQNLQESNIGKSIYSDHHYANFYTLALPTNFTKYGTIAKTMYLGNPHTLKTLSKGEIIFGAEATFRSFVVCDSADNCITNIHGVTISNNNNLEQSIFVKCFLDYIANNGVIDAVKVGGHGGSFAQKYWNVIPFPKFPTEKQKEIATLYHNPAEYNANDCTIKSFLDYDTEYNGTAGIYELDKTAKHLKEILDDAIDKIVKNQEVEVKF